MDQFIQPATHYRRRVDLIKDFVNDATLYLHLMTGDPIEEVRKFIVASITTGKRSLKIPLATYLKRAANGDRELKTLPLNQYLQQAMDRNEIIAPTLTTYIPASQKKSLLASYIAGNLKRRSAAKKAMFQAESDRMMDLATTLDSQQNTFKIKNNALSGAQCSAFTPMWNKTGHSTLTSVCRVATSSANANNEKFLYGNRHYYSPDIVKANLISIARHSDYAAMETVMAQFNLRCPEVDDVMACVERGAEAYWRNKEQMKTIRNLVERFSPIQRAAVLFTSDMYHLSHVNPIFVHELLAELSYKATVPLPMEEAVKEVKAADENMLAFVAILCAKEQASVNLNDVLKSGRVDDYCMIAASLQHKRQVIEKYTPFIRTFWVTDNLPSSIYAIPSIMRRGVLTSDTDSTIFTTQPWVDWQLGKVDFSDEATAVANSVVYLAGQLVRHILSTFCGNMGVEQEEIFRMKMKNEYYFPVFALTSRAKHYFAYQAAREGLVFEKMKSEIKGVALRSSAVSTQIIKLAQQTMMDIMNTVMAGEKVSLTYYVRKVATIEREVLEMVENGSFDYFKRDRINPSDSYKRGNEDHKFAQVSMWNEVFGPKYGIAPDPPYVAIKASLSTGKRAACKEWLDSIEDKALSERMKDWMSRNQKDTIGTIYMPAINLIAKGVPKEISQGVNTRSLVAQLMESFYLILEVLGVYRRNKKITRLLSDDKSIRSLAEGVLIPTPQAQAA